MIAVVGSEWSEYTDFNLAEGWVERVLNELTPFEQRMRDCLGMESADGPREVRTDLPPGGKQPPGGCDRHDDSRNDSPRQP